MTKPEFRIVERQSSLLIFENGMERRPKSSLQIFRMGDTGTIYSLMGDGFYRLMQHVGLKPFEQMGITHVQAALTDLHLKIMKDEMPLIHVERQRSTIVDGQEMNYVLITAAKENPQDTNG